MEISAFYFIKLIVLGLACWRVSYMLVNEEGPDHVFTRLREKFEKNKYSPLDCVYCTSIWVAFVLALIGYQWELLIGTFAISAVAVLTESVHSKLN